GLPAARSVQGASRGGAEPGRTGPVHDPRADPTAPPAAAPAPAARAAPGAWLGLTLTGGTESPDPRRGDSTGGCNGLLVGRSLWVWCWGGVRRRRGWCGSGSGIWCGRGWRRGMRGWRRAGRMGRGAGSGRPGGWRGTWAGGGFGGGGGVRGNGAGAVSGRYLSLAEREEIALGLAREESCRVI